MRPTARSLLVKVPLSKVKAEEETVLGSEVPAVLRVNVGVPHSLENLRDGSFSTMATEKEARTLSKERLSIRDFSGSLEKIWH